jgi:hypothetical protein
MFAAQLEQTRRARDAIFLADREPSFVSNKILTSGGTRSQMLAQSLSDILIF